MKLSTTSAVLASAIILSACGNSQEEWISNALDTASYQLKMTAERLEGTGELPRSTYTGYSLEFLESQIEDDLSDIADSLWQNPPAELLGKLRPCSIYDWTSGFFPGSLWYAYELTGDEELKQDAIYYTNLLSPLRKFKDTHDIGFMVNCSFGNALRLSPADTVKDVLIETADNLAARFNPMTGCIRSWDFGYWNYPVIIDNMMNLDLLFSASRLSGDPRYRQVAVKHAMTTMKNHFRPDYTSYHVVSYNDDGTVEFKETHQGKNDESAWSRGQGWAVYGYTSCYRETKDTVFLSQAVHVADMIMEKNTAPDLVPYWDFDAPARPDTPKDASAGALIASAFLELSTFVPDGEKYFSYAEKMLKTLSSPEYLAEKGSNEGFVLKHSTGSLPHGSEIDSPINYADYYYLEALKRYLDLTK